MTLLIAILKILLALGLCFAIVVWLMWRSLERSDDPGRLIVKWIASVVVVGVLMAVFVMCRGGGPEVAFIVPITAAACGVALGIFWGPHIAVILAKPITDALEGGGADGEPMPLYSIAEAKRKQGKYEEAIREIQKQLEQFPTDFQGWMLLAEIQAENQLNVTGACETVATLLAQPGHGPKNIAFALNRCADWELKFRQDPQAARRALERLVELLPETEQAQMALQRRAHLATSEQLAAQQEAAPIALRHFDDRLGLRTAAEASPAEPVREDLAQLAAACIQRLQTFPEDNEAREALAVIYAEHYQRLDLAEEQLEQLISAPHHPPKQVVHWLNLLADLQVKSFGEVERARQTLRRISELFPRTAFAENALNRMAYLNLEARAKQKSQAVRLGSYEKYLGLK